MPCIDDDQQDFQSWRRAKTADWKIFLDMDEAQDYAERSTTNERTRESILGLLLDSLISSRTNLSID